MVGSASLKRIGDFLTANAGWILAAYLLIPTLLKASLQQYFPIDLTVTLAAPATAVGVVWLVRHRSCLAPMTRVALVLWCLLTAVIATGLLYAPSRPIALRSAAVWVALAALPLLAAFPVAANAQQLRRLLLAFVAAGAMFAFLGLATLPFVEAGELELLSTNRLGVARIVLLVPLIGLPLLVWSREGLMRVLVLTLTPLCVFIAVGTGSRAPVLVFLALAAALVLAGVVWTSRRAEIAFLVAVTVASTVVLFIALGWLLPAHSIDRFGLLRDAVVASDPWRSTGERPAASAVPSEGESQRPASSDGPVSPVPEEEEPSGGESVTDRLRLGRLALAMFRDSLLVGAGTGGYEAIAGLTPGLSEYAHPHNLVLHTLADFGLVGLLLVGAMTAAAVATWRPLSATTIAAGVLFAFLLVNALVSNGIYENRMMWGAWLIVLGLRGQRAEGREA